MVRTLAVPIIVAAYAAAMSSPVSASEAATVKTANRADADLLADRHLALYRASKFPLAHRDEPSGDDTPVVIQNSATAAIPLAVPSESRQGDGR